MITSRFGGIEFSTVSGSATIDTLEGWYAGPPVRSRTEDRPASDGAFGVSRVYKSARVLTQTGLLVASDLVSALSNWDQFAALEATGAPSPFEVEDDLGVRSVLATLNGPPTVIPLVDGTARYVLTLVARDPLKYGPTVSVSTGLPVGGGEGFVYPAYDPSGFAHYGALGSLGRVVLSNAGTADVWPVFEVADEHVVVIDSASGEVIVDGQSDGGASLLRAEWFPVPAGQSITVQFGLVDGGFEVKCIETGHAVQVARSVGSNPVLTVFSASGWW